MHRTLLLGIALMGCGTDPSIDAGLDGGSDVPSIDASLDAPALDATDAPLDGSDASRVDAPTDAPAPPPLDLGWTWINPTPHGNTLHGAALESATAGWAVGSRGTTVRVEDGTFAVVLTPTDTDLYAVAAVSDTLAWAVGAGGVILRWDGVAWTPVASPASTLYDVWASAPDHAVAVGGPHAIAWDGSSWSAITAPSGEHLYALSGVGRDDYWVVGSAVHHVVSGVWTEVAGPDEGDDWIDVHARASDDVWLLARNGTVARWDGASIEVVPTPGGAMGIAAVSATELWAARGVLSTLEGPTTWTNLGGNQLWEIEARDGAILAVGIRGEIVHIPDATRPSERAVAGEDTVMATLETIYAISDDDIWVGARAASEPVLHWDGTAFRAPEDGAGSLGAMGIDGTATDDVWFAGNALVHWDGTERTTVASASSGTTLADVVALERGHALAVGWRGEIIEAGPAGVVIHDAGTTRALESVWAAAPDDVFVVGEAGTILRWDGTTWSAMDAGVTVNLWTVHGRAADDVWAAGDDGTILHWDGTAWAQLATTATTAFLGMTVSDGVLWLVGREPGSGQGEIWRSEGDAFVEERPGTGGWINDVAALPDGTLWAVGFSSQVLRRPAP